MKILIPSILLFSLSVFGHEVSNISNSIEVNYANIYADQLIVEFDKSLENQDSQILDNPVYAKLQAARDFIENQGSIKKFGSSSILEVVDSKIYNSVVELINENSLEITYHQNQIKNLESNRGVVYPSSSSAGNLTGNTFPKNVWSLTFDDGPRSKRTETIVDHLYRHNMKASFFMLTREAKRYPKSVDYVLDANMELALHSYTHKNLNKANATTINYEVGTALKELSQIGQRNIRLFRLPYGSGLRNSMLRNKITENKLIHVFWNVDTLDWKDKDPKSIFKRTVLQMAKTPRKSGVILFHDIHPQTVIASEMVMNYLNNENKTVCTVGEVVDYLNGMKQDCLK